MHIDRKLTSRLPWRIATRAPAGLRIEAGSRFLAWTVGLIQLLLGLAMLIAPAQFVGAAYSAIRPNLSLYGLALCCTGVLLLIWQVLALQIAWLPPVSLLASAASLGLLVYGFAVTDTWSGVAAYGVLALGMVAVALDQEGWLRRHRVDLFMAAAAFSRAMLALLLLFFARTLPAPTYASIQPHARLWGLSMVAVAVLLCAWQRARTDMVRRVLALLAAAPILIWTFQFGVRGNLLASLISSGPLALGVILRPFIPDAVLGPPARRLANKFAAVSVATVGAVLIVMVVVLLQQTGSAYQRRAQLDLTTTGQVVAHSASEFVHSQLQLTELLSHDPEVTDFNTQEQLAFTHRIVTDYPDFVQVSILNRAGVTLVRSTGEQPDVARAGQIPGVTQILQDHQPGWELLQSPTQGIPVLALRTPVPAADGSFNGVLATQVPLATLSRQLADIPRDRTVRVVIVDSRGQVVAYPDPRFVSNRANLSDLPPVRAALSGHPAPIVYHDGGTDWLSVQVPVPDLGWTILIEQPENDVLAPNDVAHEQAYGALVLLLLVTTAAAIATIQRFSRRVTDLARAAREFGEGVASPVLPAEGKDEVGDLVRAFREMSARLIARTQERQRAEREREQMLLREQAAREEVEALLAATASLGVQAAPEEVLRTLVEQAATLLNGESAAYAIARGDRLVTEGTWTAGGWTDEALEVPMNGSILGLVWSGGLLFRTNDLRREPLALRGRPIEHRSMLAAPLLSPAQERLGCLVVWNSRQPEGFSARDERLLVAVCQTGAAVLLRAREESARLSAERAAARRKQEVEGLLLAADRLNRAVDPEEVLLGVVSVAAELLAVSRVGIATNEGDHALRRYTWIDGTWHATQLVMPLETSLSGWVIAHGVPYRSDNFRDAPLIFPPAADAFGDIPETALTVPIIGGDGRVLGCLSLFDRRDRAAFTDDDQRLAEGIAHHAAAALERATLTAELRESQEQLKLQAYYDALTGLPNRPVFMDRLADALAAARRRADSVAVLFLDLDGFKLVNDSLGHAAGDELLVAVASRLATGQRPEDTVSRFGGDEFAVLLDNIDSPQAAQVAAERIIADLRRPFEFNGREIVITASIGIALSDQLALRRRPGDLLREADIALYQAKAAGKARAVIFDPTMSAQAVERLDLETSLRGALDRDEFRLVYQPIVELSTGSVVGVEALLRWQHPARGLLSPETFIPLAEETGLILPIGRWVLHEACRTVRAWQLRRPGTLPLRLCVNLSARQFEQEHLVEQVTEALRESGLPASSLELEITESAVIRNPEATIATLAALKRLGVTIAIDDFGIGYSSLGYLQRLTVDTLKVDRSFMAGIGRDRSTAAIVRAITVMSHALNISVTAEGIETAEQLSIVRALGCDHAQGYYLAKPMPAELFEDTPAQVAV